jgi:hypothetical protein
VSDLILTPVPKDLLGVVWPRVKEYISKAVDTAKGKVTTEDVRSGIESDVYLLWVVMDGDEIIAAITTRVINYPTCNGMALDWIGGKRIKEWIAMVNGTMRDHAKNHGCSHLEGYGRPAWTRLIARHGWQEDYVAFRMEV